LVVAVVVAAAAAAKCTGIFFFWILLQLCRIPYRSSEEETVEIAGVRFTGLVPYLSPKYHCQKTEGFAYSTADDNKNDALMPKCFATVQSALIG